MILVVGAGVAGLAAVERLATSDVPVTLVTAGRFGTDSVSAGNTALAQGGIAAALNDGDSPALHQADTLAAGAGLVDAAAGQRLTQTGRQQVQALLEAGFPADRDRRGKLIFGLEGAHTRSRILHAGEDNTGAVLSDFLTARVQQLIELGTVQLIDQTVITDLQVASGQVRGITCLDPTGPFQLSADAVILATGGFAGLFPSTSSSAAVTGQGLLAAARAGAVVADMEFIQFHPTVLPVSGELITEAVRGAGAVLRDAQGKRFMPTNHPDAELAPRDVVSRASVEAMQASGSDTVWLDATVIEQRFGPGTLAARFPKLTQILEHQGIDWSSQAVPVAPAAHYCMGGVATDTAARSSIPGLCAAGEVASTGVHGANRLASNSLLEGLVFGARAANTAMQFRLEQRWNLPVQFQGLVASATALPAQHRGLTAREHDFTRLQTLVGNHLGITRSHTGLSRLIQTLPDIDHPATDVVQLIATAALARTESRGGHWRDDFPNSDIQQATRTAWRLHPVKTPVSAESVKEHREHVDA